MNMNNTAAGVKSVDTSSVPNYTEGNPAINDFLTGKAKALPDSMVSSDNNIPTIDNTSDDKLVSAMDEVDKAIKDIASDNQNVSSVKMLASHIRSKFTSMREAKTDITDKLVESALQRSGKYSDEKLAEIQKMNGTDIFMNITSTKCRAVEAWIRDIFSDSIYDIEPTSIPEINPNMQKGIQDYVVNEIMSKPETGLIDNPTELINYIMRKVTQSIKEEAKTISVRMKGKIDDYLQESGWYTALFELISDLVTYKAGILKGPVLRKKDRHAWEQDEATGKWNPVPKNELVIEFERPSPFDVYFSPGASSVISSDIIERHELVRQDLVSLIGVAGYDEASIRAVISEYSSGYKESELNADDRDKTDAISDEDSTYNNTPSDTSIDALEYWGSATGEMLIDWGMSAKDITDKQGEYQINAWMVGNYVIKAVINKNTNNRKPYYVTSFENINGSIWGRGVPELLSDIQAVCNALARALINNAAISSSPQVMVDLSRIDESTDITKIWPGKIHYWESKASNSYNNTLPPISFFQPQLNMALMSLYDNFEQKADNYLGVPAYTYGVGANTGGVGRTATGFNMLMANAAKGIKFVISNIDKNIIEPSIEALYEYIMINDPDESIKGDIKIVAKGSSSLLAKEQMQQRRIELLNITANPIDMEIMGKKGRSNLLRDVISSAYIDTSKVIPDEEEFEMQDKLARQNRENALRMQANNPQGMIDNGDGGSGGTMGNAGMGQNNTVNNGDMPNLATLDPNGEPTNGQNIAQFTPPPQG
jgi:hypothetical protein